MIKRFFGPRGFTFMLLFPLMLIMPFVLTSFFYGFPYPYYLTNSELTDYEFVFSTIELPEEATSVGSIHTRAGNLIDNIKIEEERLQTIAEELEKLGEDSPGGTFGETDENDDEEEEIINGCDYLSARLIRFNEDDAELQAGLQEAFVSTVNAEGNLIYYGLVVASKVNVVPINSESLTLSISNFTIDILGDFEITTADLNFEDNSYYVVYMINDNVNEYTDPRCE